MKYRETLPPDCPLASARGIMEPTVRYRLLETAIARPEDFDSYVKRNGQANPRIRRTPCEQSGVSLYATYAAAQRELKGRYNTRGRRWQSIGELTLSSGAGMLNPVEANDHQTWWPSRGFNPVKNCQVIL